MGARARRTSDRVQDDGGTALTARRRLAALLSQRDTRLWLLVCGLVAARTVLSIHDLALPGLQQDETVFVNAATLRLPGLDISSSVHGVPLMLVPYVGALKAWIYDPLFAVFGTSASVIRVPVVLLVGVGLLLLYAALKELINRPVALLTVALLCFDNSLFWLTRDDVGPSALEFALKCAALFCAARFARSPRRWWVALLLASLAIGVFNKLNFIWVVNAALVVSLLLIARYRHTLRAHRHLLTAWLGGLAVIYVGWGLYYFLEHVSAAEGPGAAFAQRWLEYRLGTSAVLSGTWFYDYALAPLPSRMVIVWIVIALFVAGTVASVTRGPLRQLNVAWMALATVLITIQILVTPQATAGWHYIAIYPFVTAVAAYGVYAVARTLLSRRALVYIAIGAVGALGLTYSGLLMAKYFNALTSTEPQFSAWSPAIYALSADLRHTRASIFTADWGIFEPLFALEPSTRYTELAFALQNPAPANLATVRSSVTAVPGAKLIVTHTNGRLIFPTNNANLFRAFSGHLHLLYTVTGTKRLPVYEVYSYS